MPAAAFWAHPENSPGRTTRSIRSGGTSHQSSKADGEQRNVLGAGGTLTPKLVKAGANETLAKKQRALGTTSGSSLLLPLRMSEKADLSTHVSNNPRTIRDMPVCTTPRRAAKRSPALVASQEHHETFRGTAGSLPPNNTRVDMDDPSDSSGDSDYSDIVKPRERSGIRQRTDRQKTTRRSSWSPSPSLSPAATQYGQDSSEVVDSTPTTSPNKSLRAFQPMVPPLPISRPSSSEDCKAILTFIPSTSRSPRKQPPRPRTPPATKPPPYPAKGRLTSPSKKAQPMVHAPFRPSIDAFWSATVVNEWNDQYSPKKDCLTSPRKTHFKDLLTSSNSLGSDDEYVSPSTSPRKSPAKQNAAATKRKKDFEARKHSIAEAFLKELDCQITHSQLDALAASSGGVKLIWSRTLNSTAGRANWRRETLKKTGADGSQITTHRHEASIELAEKVIDDEQRLVNVLAHEFCHLANFMVSGVKDRPHGKEFKAWAAKVSSVFHDRGIEVTTKHSYQIDYKYIWACENCGMEFKRHSKSIDPKKHSCGSCKSKLVQTKPVPRNSGTSAYAVFVKENFATVKRENPGMSHGTVMEKLGKLYKQQKAAAVADAAPLSQTIAGENRQAVDDIADALDAVVLED